MQAKWSNGRRQIQEKVAALKTKQGDCLVPRSEAEPEDYQSRSVMVQINHYFKYKDERIGSNSKMVQLSIKQLFYYK